MMAKASATATEDPESTTNLMKWLLEWMERMEVEMCQSKQAKLHRKVDSDSRPGRKPSVGIVIDQVTLLETTTCMRLRECQPLHRLSPLCKGESEAQQVLISPILHKASCLQEEKQQSYSLHVNVSYDY